MFPQVDDDASLLSLLVNNKLDTLHDTSDLIMET